MYSVKAVLSYSVVILISGLPLRYKKGIVTIFYTLTIYYVIDVYNMLFFGNYDGLGPMLMGMILAIGIASVVHFMDKYEIRQKGATKKIGF